jgi:hypothetical protein
MPALPLEVCLDSPPQEFEPWRAPPARCSNCPFSEPDPDDGKLYCKEDSAKGQAVIGPQRALIAAPSGDQRANLGVIGIVTFWPEVQAMWSCWKHPKRQQERRRLESGG